jgi:uncharacterized protein
VQASRLVNPRIECALASDNPGATQNVSSGFSTRLLYNLDMDELRINIPRRKLAAFCRRYRIKKLAFFGSVLREDFTPTSDVDVLVEFEEGYTPGLAFFALPEELKIILGREVGLLTFQGVKTSRNPIRRKAILDSARAYYVAR